MKSVSRVVGLLLVGVWIFMPAVSGAQENPGSGTKAFTLYWENDGFTGTDRDYTNGLKLTWSKPHRQPTNEKGSVTDWMMAHLPLMRFEGARRATSFSIGQNIYTPEDTERTEIVVDDRPYAGFSYLGFGFVSNNGKRRNVWEFDVGVVGPLSQGQEAQDLVHDLIGADRAKGWDHQLDNELGLELIYETKWRLWHNTDVNGFGADLIPHIGGRLGNIAIYGNAGAEFRVGWLMPNDFGTCPIRPGCNVGSVLDDGLGIEGNSLDRLGIHFFAAFEARAVALDIFLDGNTFHNSHSVEKEHFVVDLMTGIALSYGRLRMNYTYVLRTREFEQQNKNHAFGAVSLTYAY